MLFNLSDAWAQSRQEIGAAEGQTAIKPLKIGDTIAEQLWNLPLQVVNHPDGKDMITLNDYRSKKLIILDFWATWCGSCLRSMAKIPGLQRELEDAVLFLPVNAETTRDTPEKIRDTFARFKQSTGTTMDNQFYLFPDKHLYRFFPHQALPHIVWIYEGKYIGSSYAEAVNREQIETVLDSGRLTAPGKMDFLDFSPVEVLSDQLPETIPYSVQQNILFTKYIEGIGFDSGTFYRHENGFIYRITNFEPLYFFYWAFPETFRNVKTNDIIVREGIDDGLRRELTKPIPYVDGYCFEIFSRDTMTVDQVRNRLIEVLKSEFPVDVIRSSRTKDVWELELNDGEAVPDNVYAKGKGDSDRQYERLGWNTVLARLKEGLDISIVDHSAIDKNREFLMPEKFDYTDKQHALDFFKGLNILTVQKQASVPTVIFQPTKLLNSNEED